MKIYFTLFSLLLFLSCNSDDNALVETVFINNSSINLKVEETKEDIVIHVESLQDFTDNRNDEFPNTESCTIIFDANFNNQKDADIDFGISSPSTIYDICSFYIKENDAVSPCDEYETTAVFNTDFSSSSLEETPHIIWTITLSKDEFPDNRMDFAVKIYNEGIFFDYPKQGLEIDALYRLNNTYSFEW